MHSLARHISPLSGLSENGLVAPWDPSAGSVWFRLSFLSIADCFLSLDCKPVFAFFIRRTTEFGKPWPRLRWKGDGAFLPIGRLNKQPGAPCKRASGLIFILAQCPNGRRDWEQGALPHWRGVRGPLEEWSQLVPWTGASTCAHNLRHGGAASQDGQGGGGITQWSPNAQATAKRYEPRIGSSIF